VTSQAVSDEALAGVSERSALRLTGALLLGGFLLNLVATLFHPTGAEDDHPAIFREYAESDPWVAVHLGQFVGVLIALAGLLVLYRALKVRGRVLALARFAATSTIATAATWAIPQGVDGVALKQAVDAWVDASGAEQAIRFADAETVRWLEWGVQSYFRILFGLSLVLSGAAIVVSRIVAGWLGWLGVLAGLLSVAKGIDVGYAGLESGFGDLADSAFQLAVLVFAVGVFVTGVRRRDPLAAAQR
jgi:hypothetical protein